MVIPPGGQASIEFSVIPSARATACFEQMKERVFSYGNSTSVPFDFDIKGDSNVFIPS